MPNYLSSSIGCPFYKDYGDRWVRCEGLSDTSWLTLACRSKREQETWMRCRCCGDWKSCPIAKMLEAKYGDE